ncbi:hypothetical protein MMC30_006416 [Trapelia coarctata]|nr:hypothetical protein [Trapelia coarctata]
MTPSLSPLERLPAELLQEILLLSQNLGRAHTSPHLARSLNSDHIRTQLMISAFASDRDELHRRIRWRPEVLALQEVLLDQPWLNHAFFRKCQHAFFVDRISTAYKAFAADHISQPEQADALTEISTQFDTFFAYGGYLTALEYIARTGCTPMPRSRHEFSSTELERFVMVNTWPRGGF